MQILKIPLTMVKLPPFQSVLHLYNPKRQTIQIRMERVLSLEQIKIHFFLQTLQRYTDF